MAEPAGIYLSIPFCRQKCTYCNFASHPHPLAELPAYVAALETEILHRCELWSAAGLPAWERVPADTVYLGGGTPGMLSAEQLTLLLQAVRASFQVTGWAEATLEASPENVTEENASAWAACGIDRISLGVQSLVQQELRAVGRSHDASSVARVFSVLRVAGIENISLDLIAGLPYQTTDTWKESLEGALQLEPSHISVYMLEVDEESNLGRELLRRGPRYRAETVPADEQIADCYLYAVELLQRAGYVHYEISNFARPGTESAHNRKYWTGVPYFGFGVDAHSYDGERRWANADTLAQYLQRRERQQTPVTEWKALSQQEKLEERLFLGLRLRQGVPLARLSADFQVDVAEKYTAPIREYCKAGWLEWQGTRLRLTDRGLLFSNEVFAALLA